jgi:hypothetical protein
MKYNMMYMIRVPLMTCSPHLGGTKDGGWCGSNQQFIEPIQRNDSTLLNPWMTLLELKIMGDGAG